MSLLFSVAGTETLGMRDNQEDFFLVQSSKSGGGRDNVSGVEWVQAVLSDGMGGHAAGEVASSQASVGFLQKITSDTPANGNVSQTLYEGLEAGNAAVAQWVADYPGSEGMGCTLLGLQLDQSGLTWVSVGDSLLFLVRNGAIEQLNADHSYMSILKDRIAAGEMSEAQAVNHPQRSQLLSAVVGEELELIDLAPQPFAIQGGDLLIMASDGIDTISEAEILSIVHEAEEPDNVEAIAAALVDAVAAKEKPSQDNTSVVCIYCQEG